MSDGPALTPESGARAPESGVAMREDHVPREQFAASLPEEALPAAPSAASVV